MSLASGLLLALASKFPIIPQGVLWEWLSANGAEGPWGELWGIMGNYGWIVVELWGIMGNYGTIMVDVWGIMGNYGEW